MTRAPALARLSALVATAGLLVGASSAPAAAVDTQMTATQTVNIRAAASTSSKVLGGLVRGQTVTAVSTSSGWTKIRFSTSTAYIASRYIAKGVKIAAPVTISGRGAKVTTAALKLRSGPSTSKEVVKTLPAGVRVNAMGRSRDSYVEVATTYGRGWLTTRYLARAAGLPAVVAAGYATANVNVRDGSSPTSKVVATVAKGAKLNLTGIEENSRSQVLYAGTTRWVITTLVSVRKPAASNPITYPVEEGLTPRTIALHRASRQAWPQVTTYYGLRNDPGSDHYTGNGLDIMIPSYTTTSGKALGQKIADWAVANQQRYGVQYVIWNQQIWNVSRASDGWRAMADRGNDSANHKNHVHVSMQS
jgi:uncharacterized protein YgiM (DUF1202 family)